MDEDSRLLPVLEHLSISFLAGISGSDFVSTSLNPDGGELTASMIDDLAKQHFPPCMKNLWILLRKDKHLKYGGRQQLNLFLKVCGTYERSIFSLAHLPKI
jgi:DNA primase large subunit